MLQEIINSASVFCSLSNTYGVIQEYLEVRQHAQQTSQERAVYSLPVAFSLYEEQDPINRLALYFPITDNVETKQLQSHVPEDNVKKMDLEILVSNKTKKKNISVVIFLVYTYSKLIHTRLMAALNFVKHMCDPKTKIYS